MNRPVATCDVDDPLDVAARQMWDHDCGFVPVLEQGRLVGVITDRDVCMAAYTKGATLGAIRAGDVMSRTLQTCESGDDVSEALARMERAQVRRLPVVDGEEVVGVVSVNDLALSARNNGRGGLSGKRVAQTLAAICQHRSGAIEAVAE